MDIDLVESCIDDKVNLKLFSRYLAVFLDIDFYDANIDRITTRHKFVVNYVLHQVRILELTEIQPSIAKTDIFAIVLGRIFQIPLPLDIVSIYFGEQKRIAKIANLAGYCRAVGL